MLKQTQVVKTVWLGNKEENDDRYKRVREGIKGVSDSSWRNPERQLIECKGHLRQWVSETGGRASGTLEGFKCS